MMSHPIRKIETLAELLQWVHESFQSAKLYYGHGTDNAWDEAVQLVLFVMGLPVDSDDSVSSLLVSVEQQHRVEKLVEQRITTRKPLAYVINEAWFMGMRFYVDERVIVPRSPFAEWIENRFQPWIDETQVTRVLDMCTGSGCMAIATAKVFPQAHVDAVDIDSDALAVAQINVKNHLVDNQVHLLQSDGFMQLADNRYDVIICNPPYVSDCEMTTLPAEYLAEPRHALHAEQQGLALVFRLLAQASAHLVSHGILMMEVGNSDVLLQETFPEIPFTWLEQENGGHGLFVLSHDELQKYRHVFKKKLHGG